MSSEEKVEVVIAARIEKHPVGHPSRPVVAECLVHDCKRPDQSVGRSVAENKLVIGHYSTVFILGADEVSLETGITCGLVALEKTGSAEPTAGAAQIAAMRPSSDAS